MDFEEFLGMPYVLGPCDHVGPRPDYRTPGGVTLEGSEVLRSLEAATGVAAPVEMLERAAEMSLAIGIEPERLKPFPSRGPMNFPPSSEWTDEQIERIGRAAWAGREAGGYAIIAYNDYDLANLVKIVLAAAEAELVRHE